MPDEITQPAETTGATTQATTADPTPETGRDGQPFDAARAQRLIDQQREELKQLRTQAKETETLKARVTEFEREKLSETERQAAELADLKAKNAALETQYRDALVRTAIEREALKAGAIDADVVYALIDRAAVGFDDDGSVKGAEKAVKALLEAKPYLVGQQAGTNGSNGPRSIPATPKPAGPASRDQLIEDKAKALRASGSYTRLG